jgi:hypothetical protein
MGIASSWSKIQMPLDKQNCRYSYATMRNQFIKNTVDKDVGTKL